MSKSKGLAITAGVFGVLAVILGLVASANSRAALSYSGPAKWGGRQDAANLAAVPSALAAVCVVAAVVCVVLAVALRRPKSD